MDARKGEREKREEDGGGEEGRRGGGEELSLMSTTLWRLQPSLLGQLPMVAWPLHTCSLVPRLQQDGKHPVMAKAQTLTACTLYDQPDRGGATKAGRRLGNEASLC